MIDHVPVTDMLAAVLNICTQEELNESANDPPPSVVPVDRDKAERRKVIKNKILAVGRLSHMFSLLRCVTVAFAATYSDRSAGGSTDMSPSCLFGFTLPPFVE